MGTAETTVPSRMSTSAVTGRAHPRPPAPTLSAATGVSAYLGSRGTGSAAPQLAVTVAAKSVKKSLMVEELVVHSEPVG